MTPRAKTQPHFANRKGFGSWGLLFGLVWLALLAACVPAPPQPGLRPAGSPDVVVIGFAGRCASLPVVGDGCNPPFDNYGYLDDLVFPRSHRPRQTAQAVLEAFRRLGYSVEYFDASAFLYAHTSGISRQQEPGYLEAQGYLRRVYAYWMRGLRNPTRVVLLAHSHGTVWASLLAWNHPEVRFDYAIYLDAICSFWDADNLRNNRIVQEYYDPRGLRRPFPLNDDEASQPCKALWVPGLSNRQDLNDVVPPNVRLGLEVVSRPPLHLPPLNFIHDDDPDYRPDGSRVGLLRFRSGEDHSGVTARDSDAMQWVVAQIMALGLP